MRLAASAVALLGGLSSLASPAPPSTLGFGRGIAAVEVEEVAGPCADESRVVPGVAVPVAWSDADGGPRACRLLLESADVGSATAPPLAPSSSFSAAPLTMRVVVFDRDVGHDSGGPSATPSSAYSASAPARSPAPASASYSALLIPLLLSHRATLLASSGSAPCPHLRSALASAGIALLTDLGRRRASALASLAGGAPLVPGGASLASLAALAGEGHVGGGHVGRHGVTACWAEAGWAAAEEAEGGERCLGKAAGRRAKGEPGAWVARPRLLCLCRSPPVVAALSSPHPLPLPLPLPLPVVTVLLCGISPQAVDASYRALGRCLHRLASAASSHPRLALPGAGLSEIAAACRLEEVAAAAERAGDSVEGPWVHLPRVARGWAEALLALPAAALVAAGVSEWDARARVSSAAAASLRAAGALPHGLVSRGVGLGAGEAAGALVLDCLAARCVGLHAAASVVRLVLGADAVVTNKPAVE